MILYLRVRTCLGVLALGFCQAAFGQYTVTILNPPGSTASGAWAAQGGQQVGYSGGAIPNIAVLWTGTAASAVNLNPSGWTTSTAYAVHGGVQVGRGAGLATGNALHALQWTGTAASFIDLHPSGFATSVVWAIDASGEGGEGMTLGNEVHALLWFGSAASAVDIHPAGFTASGVYAMGSGIQVGYGTVGGNNHVLRWTGTSASATDLNPAGMTSSVANGTDAGAIVGNGVLQGGSSAHALYWTSGGQMVDLNPSGFADSNAYAIAGGTQVGYGSGTPTGGQTHALVWSGTSASAVDLHPLLGTGYTGSWAYGIDPTTGQIVGQARNSLGRYVAVMWTPVPEPATWVALGIGAILALRRSRRR